MKRLNTYKNGNYIVTLFDDGTKVRHTVDDEFTPEFPESMDIKITNYCDMDCPQCHEDSSIMGKHGDILNAKFIDTLRPYTEVAIGGGNPLSHPDLIEFLVKLNDRNVIANITINQNHFMKNIDFIKYLISYKLITGLGVSLANVNDRFIQYVKQFDNAVLHIINGIVSLDDLQKLYDNNLKILILGYKEIRRGSDYYSVQVEQKKKELYDNISDIGRHFKVISFDNLAITQLDLRRLFKSKEEWENFYMGDDGQFTMYIDMVDEKFAISSTLINTRQDIMSNIDDMFRVVRS